jgi:hypothetical protein
VAPAVIGESANRGLVLFGGLLASGFAITFLCATTLGTQHGDERPLMRYMCSA